MMTPVRLFVFNRPGNLSSWPREYTLKILYLFYTNQEDLCSVPGTVTYMFLSNEGLHRKFELDGWGIRLTYNGSNSAIICSFEDAPYNGFQHVQVPISYLDLLEGASC